MRATPFRNLLLIAAAISPAGVAAQQPPDSRPGVAVMPFVHASIGPNRDLADAMGVGLQELMITELALNPAMRVVDRRVIREILDEQGLRQTGRVDDATAARIGRIVGARYFVAGALVDNDGQYQLDARIVSVETSEIIKADRVTGSRDRLFGMLGEMAGRLTGGTRLPPLETAVRNERASRGRAIPAQAVILYSQALREEELGNLDAAKQLLRRVTNEFPEMVEGKVALQRIEKPTG